MTNPPSSGALSAAPPSSGSRRAAPGTGYERLSAGPAKIVADTLLMMGVHLRMVRWSGTLALLLSFALPAGLILMLRLTNPTASRETVSYFVAGNMVNSVIQMTLTVMAQLIASQREQRTFAYFVSLPVHKLSLVLSLFLAYLLQGLPGFAGMFFVGGLVFGMSFVPHWTLIPLVFFLGSSLAGLGAFIGVRARTQMVANAVGITLAFVFMFLLPVYYPIEALPPSLRPLVYLFPVTYGAHGVRSAILGAVGPGLWIDVAVLAGFTLASFVAVNYGLRWRDE